MSDLVTIGKSVIDWLLARNAKRTARVDEWLRDIQSRCRELVEMDDPRSDRAVLLHEQLKAVYEQASQRLPRALLDREGWNLYRGLSSARIYYWVRRLDFALATDELEALLSERRMFSSPSFDALFRMLPENHDAIDATRLTAIRQQCLKDIARIFDLRPFF